MDSLTNTEQPGNAAGRGAGMPTRSAGVPAPALGLSKAHISPHQGPEWLATVWEGGALVELQGPGLTGPVVGGGKRGRVGAFAPASRLRLMRRMARVRCDVLPQFVTVTYPDEFPREPVVWKRDLDTFLKRVRRQFPRAAGFWKLEMKKRQSGTRAGELAPHFHLLLWGVPLAWEDLSNRQFHWRFELQAQDTTNGRRLLKREVYHDGQLVRAQSRQDAAGGRVEVRSHRQQLKRRGRIIERETVEWWEYDGVAHLDETLALLGGNGVGCGRVELREWLSLVWFEIVGSDDLRHLRAGTRVEQVRSIRGVRSYTSKYIAKIEGTGSPVGRWWGMFNGQALPWGTPIEVELEVEAATRLRRLARRYVNQRRKKGRHPWRPAGSCAWFCEASGWLRLVRDLWEPPDPFGVAAILRQLPPVRRRADRKAQPAPPPPDPAMMAAIAAEAKEAWATWRRSVSLGGFWYTP